MEPKNNNEEKNDSFFSKDEDSFKEEINEMFKDIDDHSKFLEAQKAFDLIAPLNNIKIMVVMMNEKAEKEEQNWVKNYGYIISDSVDLFLEKMLKIGWEKGEK